jgi:hypothetical protein
MADVAVQVRDIATGEVRNVAVDFSGKLDSGETLSGTPTTSEIDTNDLSFSGQQVSTGALTIVGETVATGLAVQFTVDASTALAGKIYRVMVTCATSASQTVKGIVTLAT